MRLLVAEVTGMMDIGKANQWSCHNNDCNCVVILIRGPCYVIVKLGHVLIFEVIVFCFTTNRQIRTNSDNCSEQKVEVVIETFTVLILLI